MFKELYADGKIMVVLFGVGFTFPHSINTLLLKNSLRNFYIKT